MGQCYSSRIISEMEIVTVVTASVVSFVNTEPVVVHTHATFICYQSDQG